MPPAEEVDAAGDGEVLVVMDLRPDDELVAAGLAREVVNRVQKLRKKAGLQPTDPGGRSWAGWLKVGAATGLQLGAAELGSVAGALGLGGGWRVMAASAACWPESCVMCC
jgi:hypothetical protein